MESINNSITLVDSLFGKPIERLSCNDIALLVESKASESPQLEFKAPTKDTTEKDLLRIIIKSVVGFLNNSSGEGILILGIKDKDHADELSCIPYDLLGNRKDKVESRLRSWIFNYIGSIPPALSPPKVIMKIFECSECGIKENKGWIVIIYVKRTFDALYYSRLDDTVYQRRGSETRKLQLEELFQIVESKRQPMIFITMKPEIIDIERIKLLINFYNIGSKPADAVVSLITLNRMITLSKSLQCSPSYIPTEVIGDVPINSIHYSRYVLQRSETSRKIIFQVANVLPKLPIFPNINHNVGTIEFSYKRLPESNIMLIKFESKTFTEFNYSAQSCLIFIDLNYKDFKQICGPITVNDYNEKRLLEIIKEKALVYDGTKCGIV